MKKIIKKISILLCLLLLVSSMTACFANRKKDDPSTLYIKIFEGGYGSSFIDEMGKEFMKENPGITVKKIPTSLDEGFKDELLSGVSTTDIFFSRFSNFASAYDPAIFKGVTYESAFADLSDIYEANVPGESIKFKDKLNSAYSNYNKITKDGKDKYYSVQWVNGMLGILYNKELWDTSWQKPRTTDELFSVSDKMVTAGKVPFAYCLSSSYWELLSPIWAEQYQGKEGMQAFWDGYDADGNRYQPTMLLNQGYLEMLKVMERLLNSAIDYQGIKYTRNNYMHEFSKSLDFTSIQSMFLKSSNNIVMMPNGDWIENEMSNNPSANKNIGFLKTPVISSLGGKLGITESELIKVVDYVDGASEIAPSFTSSVGLSTAEVIEKVRYARNLVYTNSNEHIAYIPAYSNQIPMAKKFLQFMATDKAIEIFVDKTKGYTSAFNYDYLGSSATSSKMSEFLKEKTQLMSSSTVCFTQNKNKLFSIAGLKPTMNGQSSYEGYFSASNAKDFKNAETVFIINYEKARDKWDYYTTLAGI